MSLISIPEPCHENWAEFTPTEKGAFCGSCQIDVVDFSNMSPNEISATLKKNAGQHLCGRFRKSQINAINNDYAAWKNQSTKTFQSKFLYACLIVFGMSLFTSCSTDQHVLGELNVTQVNLSAQQIEMGEPEDSTEVIQEFRKGKIAYTPTPTDCSNPPDSLEEELHVKGEIAYPIDEFIMGDTIFTPTIDTLKDSTVQHHAIQNKDSLFNDEMIDGKIKVDISQLPPDNVSINESYPEKTDLFTAKVYPNPNSEESILKLEVKETSNFNIYLYSVEGKKVKDIFSGKIKPGTHSFSSDLTPYKSGQYLIVIHADGQKESIRLEKVD